MTDLTAPLQSLMVEIAIQCYSMQLCNHYTEYNHKVYSDDICIWSLFWSSVLVKLHCS